jgi:hypothetical protein
MNTIKNKSRVFSAAGALLCALAASVAFAQYKEPQPNDGTTFNQVNTKPSANNDLYNGLKTRCETDVSCGKTSGDVCAEAAAVLLGNDPPDNYRDMASVQKSKIALRLLERGVDTSNLAAARAYDLYNKTDIGGFLTGGVADSYRAAELMDIMTKRNYAGASLRKARSAVSLFSFTTPEAEKRQQCDTAKQMLAGGKLDEDSKAVAGDILDSTICKNMAAAQTQQPQN